MSKGSIEDLKTLKNWALGIIAFATGVSTFLVQALGFRPQPTILAVSGFACLMLLIVFLISRSERRQEYIVKSHIEESDKRLGSIDDRFDKIDEALLDIQRSTLRTEMNDEIHRNPHNHDTIIKMAEKYFNVLQADWVETNIFLDWADSEKIKLPPNLLHIKRD